MARRLRSTSRRGGPRQSRSAGPSSGTLRARRARCSSPPRPTRAVAGRGFAPPCGPRTAALGSGRQAARGGR
eukprot:3930495-Lingulodinium_polyedra.AAC.1